MTVGWVEREVFAGASLRQRSVFSFCQSWMTNSLVYCHKDKLLENTLLDNTPLRDLVSIKTMNRSESHSSRGKLHCLKRS